MMANPMHAPASKLNHVDLFSAMVMRHRRPLILLCLSAALVTLYLIGRPYILYNDSDPLTYFRKAWWYIGHAGGMDVPSRGPGYPIWLILTGAASFDFWWGLMSSQVLMAVAVPVLVYAILAPISRNAGFVAGLLFMVFGISYQHMNWVMVEELFLFVELLSFLLISLYLCQAWGPLPPKPAADADRWARASYGFQAWLRTLYSITLLLAYATLIKPSASPFFWLLIFVCVVFRVEHWKRYVRPVLLYMAIMTAWGSFGYFKSPVGFSPLGMPLSLAQRNFAEVYYGHAFGAVNGWTLVETPDQSQEKTGQPPTARAAAPTIRPEDGPASQKLYQAVAALVASNRESGKWNINNLDSVHQLYGRYPDNDELTKVMFLRPNPTYFQTVVQAAASAGGDRLLRSVAGEHYNSGVLAYLHYLWRHPTLPLKGPPNSYVGFMFFMKLDRFQNFHSAHHYGFRDVLVPQTVGNLINPNNGPASKAFAKSIRFFVNTYPQFIGLGPDVIRDLGGKDGLIKFVLDHPYSAKYSGAFMGWVYQWLSLLYGEEESGSLMAQAAMEAVLHKRAASTLVIADFVQAALFSGKQTFGQTTGYLNLLYGMARHFGQTFASVNKYEEDVLKRTVQSGRANHLPAELTNQVGHFGERSALSTYLNTTLLLQYGAFVWLKPLLVTFMVIFALPLILTSVGGQLVAFLVLTYFVSAAAWTVVMIPPGGDPRHEDVFAFIPLLVTALGFASLPQFIRLAVHKSRPAEAMV